MLEGMGSILDSARQVISDLVEWVADWYQRQAGRMRRSAPVPARVPESTALANIRSEAPRQRWEAAAALGRNPQCSGAALAALVEALADPEPFVRWEATEALVAQEPGRVFPALQTLLEGPNPLGRAGAAEALSRVGGDGAGAELRNLLHDPEPQVRVAAAEAIGNYGDPAAAAALVPLLDDAQPDVQRAAANALGRIGTPAVAGNLASALVRQGRPLLVRRAMMAALARAPHPRVQPVLIAALADRDAQVRGYAAQALGRVGSQEAVPALTAALVDEGCLLQGATVADEARRALALLERRGRQAG